MKVPGMKFLKTILIKILQVGDSGWVSSLEKIENYEKLINKQS